MMKAEFIHREEIMCPLPSTDLTRRKRSSAVKVGQGYTLSVSNDGRTFSDEHKLLSFNTKCISCNGTCSIKVMVSYLKIYPDFVLNITGIL